MGGGGRAEVATLLLTYPLRAQLVPLVFASCSEYPYHVPVYPETLHRHLASLHAAQVYKMASWALVGLRLFLHRLVK